MTTSCWGSLTSSAFPAPRGMPQVEVSFDIDANGRPRRRQRSGDAEGTVHQDHGVQRTQQRGSGQAGQGTRSPILKKTRNAVGVAEARNQADSLLYSTEKNLTEHGDKIGEDDKTKITEAIAGLRKAMEGDDPAAIESATQTLTTASHKLAEEMYKKASASAGPADAGASAGDGGRRPRPTKRSWTRNSKKSIRIRSKLLTAGRTRLHGR